MPERREEREEGKKEINNIGRARMGLENNLSGERGKHNDRERNKRETAMCFTDLTHKDAHIMTTKITLLFGEHCIYTFCIWDYVDSVSVLYLSQYSIQLLNNYINGAVC